ncbi:sodium-independent sulfate anion transporter-like [Toxorhynchites rutilus septentrionalis]|uniref:sodium-independent sulfate anion transporter-like n=1 Tax=Toxorhynchites rutilus septentrionalis TaxID=329112 RepID=UPI0024786A12|nr:sodium-independent sulfate anion transporter-like [Toxorhynchites rutilus septentrionalis]
MTKEIILTDKELFPSHQIPEDFDHNYQEQFPDLRPLIRRQFRGIWTRENALRRFPALQWGPQYTPKQFLSDAIAGITVGLTSIPQSIAYAVVANLEPQYGLYSNFMGSFVYAFFGSVKDITIAPTAIMALMVQQKVLELGPAGAILSSFLSGCIILLLGMINFGFVVQFISMPVITGFITAAAMTIMSSQVKSLMGISSPGKSSQFIDSWSNIFENIGQTQLWDSLLGFGSLAILICFTLIKGRGTGRWRSFTKYLCLLRNALIVISGGTLAYICATYDTHPFRLTGKVASGFPSLEPPPFSTTIKDEFYDFPRMLQTLGSSIITIPLISILEIVSIGKAFAKGKPVDATQEMIALGLCNIAGSFTSSIPTTASFARSAINSSSGVKTPFGGVFTGVLVLLALGLLTEYFYYIPKATLSAVIIAAMVFMIEYRAVAEMWRIKRIDIIPFLVTVVACLLTGLELGIMVGIGVNLCFLLYLISRPRIDHRLLTVDSTRALFLRPTNDLAFSSAEYLREKIIKMAAKHEADVVVIDGELIKYIDSTVVKNMAGVVGDLKVQGKYLLLWRWNREVQYSLYRYKKDQFLPLFKADANEELMIKNWRTVCFGEGCV